MAIWCRCPCHHETTANRHDQKQRRNPAGVAYYATEDDASIPPMVQLHDQLEILVAVGCECVKYHNPLPLSRPRYKPPHPWNPQADGEPE